MILINVEQVKELHKEVIDNTSGSHGIRDDRLLDAAIASASQTFGGEDLYPSVTAKIARIAFGIIRNHPFVDGNKRIHTPRPALQLSELGLTSSR